MNDAYEQLLHRMEDVIDNSNRILELLRSEKISNDDACEISTLILGSINSLSVSGIQFGLLVGISDEGKEESDCIKDKIRDVLQ